MRVYKRITTSGERDAENVMSLRLFRFSIAAFCRGYTWHFIKVKKIRIGSHWCQDLPEHGTFYCVQMRSTSTFGTTAPNITSPRPDVAPAPWPDPLSLFAQAVPIRRYTCTFGTTLPNITSPRRDVCLAPCPDPLHLFAQAVPITNNLFFRPIASPKAI